jgi:hypothetical protein
MGIFKRMKDMKDMIEAAPGMVAQAQMASLNQMMAAQAQAANAAATGSSVRRTVTINGMRQIGMLNFDLLVEFDLTVLPDGMPPYPATTQQRVSQMQIGQLRPGQTLQASVDPSNPAAIWLDLETLH